MVPDDGAFLGGRKCDGWGTVIATDTAFVIGCLALLGSRIPQSLRIFMLSLAIVDDIGAILVVAGSACFGLSGYRHRTWNAAKLGILSASVFSAVAGIALLSEWSAYTRSGTFAE